MGVVDHVEEANLPPKPFRRANHYWRINSTLGAGYMIASSCAEMAATYKMRLRHIIGNYGWPNFAAPQDMALSG